MNHKVETLDRSFKENIQIEYPKDLTEIINLINSNKKISLIGSGLSLYLILHLKKLSQFV